MGEAKPLKGKRKKYIESGSDTPTGANVQCLKCQIPQESVKCVLICLRRNFKGQLGFLGKEDILVQFHFYSQGAITFLSSKCDLKIEFKKLRDSAKAPHCDN